MKFIKVIFYFLLLFCFLSSNNFVSFSKPLISEENEYQYGLQESQRLEKNLYLLNNQKSINYIQNIVNKLADSSNQSNISYRAKIFISKEINAISIPGGFIYISTGMLQNLKTESELVGVLAHEIAHITERHAAKEMNKKEILMNQFSYNQGDFINLEIKKFHHQAEFEADEVGAQMMYYAGWNPQSMLHVLENTPESIKSMARAKFSTHPTIEARIENLQKLFITLKNKYNFQFEKSLKQDSAEFHELQYLLEMLA